jgi:hypothetical protein
MIYSSVGRSWLKDVKITRDWENNLMTIKINGTVKIIVVTNHLGVEVKWLEVLLCYDYQNGIINEEEDIIFHIKP